MYYHITNSNKLNQSKNIWINLFTFQIQSNFPRHHTSYTYNHQKRAIVNYIKQKLVFLITHKLWSGKKEWKKFLIKAIEQGRGTAHTGMWLTFFFTICWYVRHVELSPIQVLHTHSGTQALEPKRLPVPIISNCTSCRFFSYRARTL